MFAVPAWPAPQSHMLLSLLLLVLLLLVLGAVPSARGEPPAAGTPASRIDRFGDPLPSGALARMGTVRLRHGSIVSARLLFLPDGHTLITSCGGRDIRFWDVASGKEVRRLEVPGEEDWPRAIALSPDGKVLAVGGYKTISLWDSASGRPIRQFRSGGVRCLTFTPDGKTLVSGGLSHDSTVRFWDVATGKERRRRLWHSGEVSAVAVTPDGHTLISISSSKVHFANLATAEEVGTLTNRRWSDIHVTALSPDGKALVLGGLRQDSANRFEGFLLLVEVPSGRELNHFDGLRGMAYAVALSPDGKTLAAVDYDRTLHFWDAASGKELRKVEGLRTLITAMAFSPDGRVLATHGGSAVRLWETATGKELRRRDGHEGEVDGVAFSPDGKLLATGSYADRTARLWDAATGRPLRLLPHKAYVRPVAFLPDGKTLLTAGGDSKLRFWDVATGKEARALRLKGRQQVLRLSLSADGQRLLCGSTGFDFPQGKLRLTVWDVGNGKLLSSWEGPFQFYFPGLSAEGQLAAEGGGKEVVVREADTGKERFRLKADDRLDFPFIFAPGGKLLAVGSHRPRQDGPRHWQDNYAVRLFDLSTGKERRRFALDNQRCQAMAFSPDGALLAAGGQEGFRVWDVASGKERLRRTVPGARVQSIAFSPDGRRLATGLNHATALVWEVPPAPTPSP